MKKAIKGLSIASLILNIIQLVKGCLFILAGLGVTITSIILNAVFRTHMLRYLFYVLSEFSAPEPQEMTLVVLFMFIFGFVALTATPILLAYDIPAVIFNAKHLKMLKKDDNELGVKLSGSNMLVLGVFLFSRHKILGTILALVPGILSQCYKEKEVEQEVEVVVDKKEVRKENRVRAAFEIAKVHDKYNIYLLIGSIFTILFGLASEIFLFAARLQGTHGVFTLNFTDGIEFLKFYLLCTAGFGIFMMVLTLISFVGFFILFAVSISLAKKQVAQLDGEQKAVAIKNGAITSVVVAAVYFLVNSSLINVVTITHAVKALILFLSLPKAPKVAETNNQ